MGEKNAAYEKFLGSGRNTERLQFFSDAVFAIAMTLLVIDIAIPDVHPRTGAALWQALGNEWQRFFAYVLSFAVIAINWIGHHRRFRLIRDYDPILIWVNFALLALIAFVPYPTSLLSEYGDLAPAVILYAATVALISLTQFWSWSYAFKRGLTDKVVDLDLYRYSRRNQLVVPVVFLLSIPIALVNPMWATLFWIVNWPVSIIVGRYESKGPISDLAKSDVSRSQD